MFNQLSCKQDTDLWCTEQTETQVFYSTGCPILHCRCCSEGAETQGFRLFCGCWKLVGKVLFVFRWNPQISRASHPHPMQLSRPAMIQVGQECHSPEPAGSREQTPGNPVTAGRGEMLRTGTPLLPWSPSPKQDALLKPGSPMHLMAISKNDSSTSKKIFHISNHCLFKCIQDSLCAYISRV